MTRCLSGRFGRRLLFPIFVIAALALDARPASADTLRGRVADPQGRPVAGAMVVVAHTVTRDTGEYGPIVLPAGDYDLTVSAPGLRSAPQRISIEASRALERNVTVELSAVSETVVVSAAQVETPLSQATSSVTVIDRATIDTRQAETVSSLVGLVPGFHVVQSGGRGAVTSFFPRGGVEGGGYGTWRVDGSTTGSLGPWSWGASVDYLTTDGDTREVPDLGTRVSNDDYMRTAGAASVGWSDRPSRRLRVDFRQSHDERGFPGPYGSDPENLYEGIDTISRGENDTTSIGVSTSIQSHARLRHAGSFSWSRAPREFTSPFGESDDETRRVTGRYQLDVDGLPMGLSAGVEVLAEQADNTFITGELFQPVPVERFVTGWFAESRFTLGSRGALNAGLRLERIARRALEASGNRPEFDEDVVWSANPRVAAIWFLRPSTDDGWTRLRVSGGTGIKPPTAFEIAFTDNPGLKPERSRSVDAGIEHAFAKSAAVVDVTWFYNRYDDLIVTVGSSFAGASRYRTDNISNARAQGLETGGTWRSPWGVQARLAWTWLDTEILGVDDFPTEAPSPYVVGESLIRRPNHRVSLDVQWTSERATAFVGIVGRGSMRDIEPNFAATVYDNPGFTTVDIGGSWRVGRGLEVTARVTNLFDRDYEEALGFPALGRSAMVGLRVGTGR
ncbi:MAG TPA: TonB-dependent receptor [Vicinamibacterales bacterium]|nr:TonB-dependent receptor [Vicinamibacterales bacterium]